MDVKKLIQDCVAKSKFLTNYPSGQLFDTFFAYIEGNVVDDDMGDPDVFNSGFYSGYSVSANIKNMKEKGSEYFLPTGVETQIPIQEGTYDNYTVFNAPNKSPGVRGTVYAEHIQDMYDDIHDKFDCKDVSDITVEVVNSVAKNIFAVDMIPVPTKSFYGEKDLDYSVKLAREDIFETLGVVVGSRVAVLGGDKSSASGRSRPYILDCYYYDDLKNFKQGSFARNDRSLPGNDYHFQSVDLMLEELKKTKYDCFTFNYNDSVDLYGDIFAWFEDQNIPGYGIYIDPDYNDLDVCDVEVYKDDIKLYRLDNNKMSKYGLQVKTKPDNGFVHFCTSHGFIYEKIQEDNSWFRGIKLGHYIYNRFKGGKRAFEKFLGYSSTMHYRIFFTNRAFDKLSFMYLESDIKVDEDYSSLLHDAVVTMTQITLNEVDFIPIYSGLPVGAKLIYVCDSGYENIRFVDINLDIPFYSRILMLEKSGLPTIYRTSENRSEFVKSLGYYLFPSGHKFCDEPWKVADFIKGLFDLKSIVFDRSKEKFADGVVVVLHGIGYDPQNKVLVYSDLGESFMVFDPHKRVRAKGVYRCTFVQDVEEDYTLVISDKGDYCVFGCNLVFFGKPVKNYSDCVFSEVFVEDENEIMVNNDDDALVNHEEEFNLDLVNDLFS